MSDRPNYDHESYIEGYADGIAEERAKWSATLGNENIFAWCTACCLIMFIAGLLASKLT